MIRSINSNEVIEFARTLQSLRQEVDEADRAEYRAIADDPGSSHQGEVLFLNIRNNRIIPHFRNKFWSYADILPLEAGTNIAADDNRLTTLNKQWAIETIFAHIRSMLLGEILAEPGISEQVRTGIEHNRNILTDVNQVFVHEVIGANNVMHVVITYTDEYQTAMAETRAHLSSIFSVNQTAWRNFDPEAPRSSTWRNLFVGDDWNGTGRNEETRLSLAYMYLVCTDDTDALDTLEFRKSNFRTKLADFRRGHNDCNGDCPVEGRGNNRHVVHRVGIPRTRENPRGDQCHYLDDDDPSCSLGVNGRMLEMGQGHPIAQSPLRVSELIPNFVRGIVHGRLSTAFEACPTYLDKRSLRDSLMYLHSGEPPAPGNVTSIINSQEEFSEDLLERRLVCLQILGIDRTTLRLGEDIINLINADLERAIPAQQGIATTLNHRFTQKVRLFILDPVLMFADNIQNQFLTSLTPEERAIYDEVAATAATERREPTLIEEFQRMMNVEREAEARARPRPTQSNGVEVQPDAALVAKHREHYSQGNMKKRVMEVMTIDVRLGRRRWGTSTRAIFAELQRQENEQLVDRFNAIYPGMLTLERMRTTNASLSIQTNARFRTVKRMVREDALDQDAFTEIELLQATRLLGRRIIPLVTQIAQVTQVVAQAPAQAPAQLTQMPAQVSQIPVQPAQITRVTTVQVTQTNAPQNQVRSLIPEPLREAKLDVNGQTRLAQKTIQYPPNANIAHDDGGLFLQTRPRPTSYRRLTSEGLNDVNTYGHMHLPPMPVILNSDPPHLTDIPNQNAHNHFPTISVAVALPRGSAGNLPRGVLELLQRYNIELNDLQVFFNVQNKPWANDHTRSGAYLKLQPWLHPDAPHSGNYDQTADVMVAIANIDGGFHGLTRFNRVRTYQPHRRTRTIGYSKSNLRILGVNEDNSCAFYSLCINPSTGLAALTLHWILNPHDNRLIRGIVESCHTLDDFIDGVYQSQLPKLNGVTHWNGRSTPNNAPFWNPLRALGALVSGGQVGFKDREPDYPLKVAFIESLQNRSLPNQILQLRTKFATREEEALRWSFYTPDLEQDFARRVTSRIARNEGVIKLEAALFYMEAAALLGDAAHLAYNNYYNAPLLNNNVININGIFFGNQALVTTTLLENNLDDRLEQQGQGQMQYHPREAPRHTAQLPALQARTYSYSSTADTFSNSIYSFGMMNSSRSSSGTRSRLITEGLNEVSPYSNVHLPPVPLILAENPAEHTSGNYNTMVAVPLALKIPLNSFGNLPSGVEEQLTLHHINKDNLKLFFVAQTTPWSTSSFFLKPQPWLNSDAPATGTYQSQNILMGLSEIDNRFGTLVQVNGIQTGAVNNTTRASRTITIGYPGKQLSILGLRDENAPCMFYSLCINPNTGQAALTLHWMLDSSSSNVIQGFSNCRTLETLLSKIEHSSHIYSYHPAFSKMRKPCTGLSDWNALMALNAFVFGGQPRTKTKPSLIRLREELGASLPNASIHAQLQQLRTDHRIRKEEIDVRAQRERTRNDAAQQAQPVVALPRVAQPAAMVQPAQQPARVQNNTQQNNTQIDWSLYSVRDDSAHIYADAAAGIGRNRDQAYYQYINTSDLVQLNNLEQALDRDIAAARRTAAEVHAQAQSQLSQQPSQSNRIMRTAPSRPAPQPTQPRPAPQRIFRQVSATPQQRPQQAQRQAPQQPAQQVPRQSVQPTVVQQTAVQQQAAQPAATQQVQLTNTQAAQPAITQQAQAVVVQPTQPTSTLQTQPAQLIQSAQPATQRTETMAERIRRVRAAAENEYCRGLGLNQPNNQRTTALTQFNSGRINSARVTLANMYADAAILVHGGGAQQRQQFYTSHFNQGDALGRQRLEATLARAAGTRRFAV